MERCKTAVWCISRMLLPPVAAKTKKCYKSSCCCVWPQPSLVGIEPALLAPGGGEALQGEGNYKGRGGGR